VYCGVLVHNPVARKLRVVAERWRGGHGQEPASATEPLLAVDGNLYGTAFRTGAPVLVPDVRHLGEVQPLAGPAVRSELAVPVLRDGRAVAVIAVASPRVSGLDIADLQRLTDRAAEAATAAPLAGDEMAQTA